MVIGFCFALIFLFVPETFWDRTPRPHERSRKRSKSPGVHHAFHLPSLPGHHHHKGTDTPVEGAGHATGASTPQPPLSPSGQPKRHKANRVGFVDEPVDEPDHEASGTPVRPAASPLPSPISNTSRHDFFGPISGVGTPTNEKAPREAGNGHPVESFSEKNGNEIDVERQIDHSSSGALPSGTPTDNHDESDKLSESFSIHYTDYYRSAPPKSYIQSLKPWNGRLVKDKWLHVMIRPFILFAYPAVLWSSLVYALAIGWLIVLSESVAHIYQDRESYNFTSLQVGLVYISPFVGGVLGTAVAGKISDIVVRYMARKNDGIYEPEFRLVMAIPIAISTTIGLMGFGWSAEEKNNWIVPTVFFGVISFGCSLASTTSVTFVVDSYRIYAGEALVTLNFSKSKQIPGQNYF